MMQAVAAAIFFTLLSGSVCAQSTANPPGFEGADIHVSPHRTFPYYQGGFLQGDRYVLRQATMVDLIATAYGVDASTVQEGPTWLETDRFDVTAKVPAAIARSTAATTRATAQLMLRSLLQDRFQLVIHDGSKPMPAFVLTTGKGKPKMTEAADSGDADCKYVGQNPAPGAVFTIVFSCHHTTMQEFAHNVHGWAGDYFTEPVVDSTGLKGSWDFDIKWNPKGQLQKGGPDSISIFDAVDKQLGLKLERQTAPRPVLIVDSVNHQPTPNPSGLEKLLPPLPPPQFDVATIKPAKPGAEFNAGISGGQVKAEGTSLRFLITFAWDLNPNDSEALVGAPKWMDEDRFDILAKVVNDAPGSAGANAPRIDIEDLRPMLQALLADRFKMQAHMENRPISAYTLIAVSPKLRKADPLSRTRCAEGPGPDGKDPRTVNPSLNRLVSCQNMTMAQIGDELQRIASGYIYSPVVDATQIKGSWDFTLSFSSANLTKAGAGNGGTSATPPSGTTAASDPNGALSLFDAVSKQLGLKLEKQRRPAPVLVIDHIEEKPTEN
jgi:uncharacterized protein (TIGR03435 family)